MRNKWIEPVRAVCVVLPVSLALTACMGGGASQGQSPSGSGMFSGLFGAAPAPAPVVAAAPEWPGQQVLAVPTRLAAR